MKVSELIRILQSVDPDRDVIMGQGFTVYGVPIKEIQLGTWDPQTTRMGIQKLTPKLARQGYGYEDIVKGVNALILKPVN